MSSLHRKNDCARCEKYSSERGIISLAFRIFVSDFNIAQND